MLFPTLSLQKQTNKKDGLIAGTDFPTLQNTSLDFTKFLASSVYRKKGNGSN